MFARINTIVQKVRWVKETVSDLGTQGKELLDKTKAAYQDVTQDWLGMDDLAKIWWHVQDIAKWAWEAISQAKENISKIAGKKQANEQQTTATDSPKKVVKQANKGTTSTAKKSTTTQAKKTSKAKPAA